MRRWPQDVSTTFSQHAAAQKQSIVYYALLFLVILPMLGIYFVKWLIPSFNLNGWFSVFTWLAILTQAAVALVPEVPGWRRGAHRFLAFWSALFLMLSLFAVLSNSLISGASHIITLICALMMAIIFAILVVNKAEHKYFLILQAGFFGAYFVSMLAITYIR